MIKSKGIMSFVVVCVLTLTAPAQQPRKINIPFKDIKLKNGLRVVLAEDHSLQVISITVMFDVGSRNEQKGRTGFAHLFEHMMYAGSENVGKNEYNMLIVSNGGGSGGQADEDCTRYSAHVPSNQLDMLLFTEADRMRGIDVTQDKLDMQRNSAQEERQQKIDNQAYGRTSEIFQETMYDNFAYKHLLLGSMEDLNAASPQDVRDFFRVYYAPNNAVLALVGDFRTEAALAKIKGYFESIPSQPAHAPVDTAEPEQKAERRFTIEDTLARLPKITIGFKGVVDNTPDAYAMRLLNQTLAIGQSSRLYQKLVKDKELVSELSGVVTAMRGNGDYQITAMLAPGKQLEEVETTINEEIARLQNEPIADWELGKAKIAQRSAAIQGISNSLGQSIRLAQFTLFYNDPNLINTQFDKINSVTKEDIQRVANKYLKATNRTLGITIPKPKVSAATN